MPAPGSLRSTFCCCSWRGAHCRDELFKQPLFQQQPAAALPWRWRERCKGSHNRRPVEGQQPQPHCQGVRASSACLCCSVSKVPCKARCKLAETLQDSEAQPGVWQWCGTFYQNPRLNLGKGSRACRRAMSIGITLASAQYA
jgi:hypothetical protein